MPLGIFGPFLSIATIAEEDVYDEIDQEGLYEEAIQIISSGANRKGLKEAAAILKKVAKAGSPRGQYALGSLYLHGQGVRRNQSIASKWFEESARQRHRAAMYYLGVSKLTGNGAEQDREEAKRLFSELVYPGENFQIRVEDFRWQRAIRAESSYFLATIMMEDRGSNRDSDVEAEIVELMSAAARGGSANATMFLALEHAKGTLIERDLDRTKQYLKDYHLIMSDTLRRSLDQFFVDGIDQAMMQDIERSSGEVDRVLYQTINTQIYLLVKSWIEQPPGEREVPIESIAELLSIAADGEHPLAQIELGLLYARGGEVARDHKKALDLFSKASKSSPRVAVFNQAVLLKIGEGVPRDEEKAQALLRKARNAGLYAAAALLDGDIDPIVMDDEELLELCIQKRDAGDPRALFSYTSRQEYGLGVELERNQSRLYQDYLKAAELGSLNAVTEVADRLYFGIGVSQNCEAALEWLRLAEQAERGEALFRLGFMHDTGTCVRKSEDLAILYYVRSSNTGNLRAKNNLAAVYYENDSYKHSAELAIPLWSDAAEGGIAIAMRNLGRAYLDEKVVDRDVEKAIAYLSDAVDAGDLPAAEELTRIYRTGDGVEIDIEEESYWIERAAEFGHRNSISTIAHRYYRGYGVPKSKYKAMQWATIFLNNRSNSRYGRYDGSSSLYLIVADLMSTKGWSGYDPDEAVKLYRKIEDMDIVDASHELAKHYHKGSFGEKLQSKAFSHYMKGVKRSEPTNVLYGKCAYGLSICYRDGIGTKANESRWIDWLEKSVAARSPFGAYDLAIARLEGRGVEKDEEEGLRLMMLASKFGLRKAHLWLSEYYFAEQPDSRESEKALAWLKGLALEGNVKARELLKKFNFEWREIRPAENDEQEKDKEDESIFPPIKAA